MKPLARSRHWLRLTGAFAIDMIYPRTCAGCGRRGSWLCPSCAPHAQLFFAPFCERCGVPMALEQCRCARMPDALQQVRSAGAYAGWLRGAIVQMKYQGEWARAEFLAELMAGAMQELLPADALAPVPLHPSRLMQRGFNQSAVLARHLGARAELPVVDALIRARRTAPQVGLGLAARSENVRAAFAVSPHAHILGQRIVLVDDVITSGATLGACAELLLASGAASVGVITLAREL